MRLFREENFQVIVDPEVKTIPEFRKLVTRDKDRFKRTVFLELAYIYHMCDHRSPYAIYSSDERKVRVRKDLKLPSGWVVDSDMTDALKKYEEFMVTPTIKSLTAIREGLLSSAKVIDALRIRIDQALSDADRDDGEEPVDIGSIVRSVTQLLDLSDKLPRAIDTISDLEEKVKKEQGNDSRIRGGGKKGMFEE